MIHWSNWNNRMFSPTYPRSAVRSSRGERRHDASVHFGNASSSNPRASSRVRPAIPAARCETLHTANLRGPPAGHSERDHTRIPYEQLLCFVVAWILYSALFVTRRAVGLRTSLTMFIICTVLSAHILRCSHKLFSDDIAYRDSTLAHLRSIGPD